MNLYKKAGSIVCLIKEMYIEKKYEKLFKKHGSRKLDQNKNIYYIIRRYPKGAGFFSNYLTVLSHVAYAEQNGYMPVVDMENYPSHYNEKAEVNGTKNAWEYYFRQINDISLKEAYKSKNYILSDTGFQKEGMKLLGDIYFFPLENDVEFYGKICGKIKFESMLENELQCACAELFFDKRKTLGVHIRGTDMRRKNSEGHPQSLELEEYIKMIKKFLQDDTGIERIYLATDEEETKNKFVRQFGEKVCTSDAFRAKGKTDMGIHYAINNERKNHHYLLGKEVLRDAYLLSQCDKLICGLSNVASTAIIWNHNQYEKIGILCTVEYGNEIKKEIDKRKINSSRYVIGIE